MMLTFDKYTITGTPQEIDEFIKIHNTTTMISNGANYETKAIAISCPKCYSTNIKALYGSGLANGTTIRTKTHYICEDCHKEFEIEI